MTNLTLLEMFKFPLGKLLRRIAKAGRTAIQDSGQSNMIINTSGHNDRTECILEGHLQFMRDFVARDEARNKATVDRFLAGKLSQKVKHGLLN